MYTCALVFLIVKAIILSFFFIVKSLVINRWLLWFGCMQPK